MSLNKFFKSIFGTKDNHVYYVDISDIYVTNEFKKTTVSKYKYRRKKQYYLDTGNFETPVTLKRKTWTLVDGYTTYLLCKSFGQKVPVVFVH